MTINQYTLTSTGYRLRDIMDYREDFHSNLFHAITWELEDQWKDCRDEIHWGRKASIVIDIDEVAFAFDYTMTREADRDHQGLLTNYNVWYNDNDNQYKNNKGHRGLVMLDIFKLAEILNVDIVPEEVEAND